MTTPSPNPVESLRALPELNLKNRYAVANMPIGERLQRGSLIDENGCWIWTVGGISSGYGYASVNRRRLGVHVWSYLTFKGAVPPGMQVCHHCDVPLCCNPDHLFLGSKDDNLQDARKKGRLRVGERSPMSKLKDAQVLEIRARWPGVTKASLAREFGVTISAIDGVTSGRTWKHILAKHSTAAEEGHD